MERVTDMKERDLADGANRWSAVGPCSRRFSQCLRL
jgi:hypothetical protein